MKGERERERCVVKRTVLVRYLCKAKFEFGFVKLLTVGDVASLVTS